MCIFSFFRKINIERNTKLKLIAYIQRHNISLIEATNVAFHQAKNKERGWTENFFTHCIMSDMLADSINDK